MPDVPQPQPPQGFVSTEQVAGIVAQAVNAAMTSMATHFPQQQPPQHVAPAGQVHPGMIE